MTIGYPLLLALAAAVPLHAETDGSPHALCDAHANALIDALGDAKYDAATADFDAALRARLSAAQLRKDYEALPASLGKLLGRGRPHLGDVGGHTVVMAPLIFEHGTVTAEVHCDGEGAVSDVRLQPTQAMGRS
ncbi:MAG TPA: hypothetical protein VKB52_07625 [Rhodanobacteraceae bacterium]|nr:hypothetical protein [Rhodanobacteraceae bacterium]